MEIFSIFNQILILFILVIAGYAARKINIFDEKTTSGLAAFLVKIALPALIISSMQIPFTSELLGKGEEMFLISLVFYAISFLIAWYVPRLLGCSDGETGVYQFLLMFSNVGFMGYPVVNAIFGQEGLFYTSIFNLPFHMLVFTVGIVMLKKSSGDTAKISPRMFINPGIIAVIIGLVLFVFSIQIPGPLGGAVTMLGDLTTPLSMILVGALLGNISRGTSDRAGWRLYAVTSVRLLAIPVVTYLILRPFISDPLLLGIPVIIAAMPGAANAAMLAEEYHANAELASQGVFLSTLFCILTIPAVAMLVI